MFIGGWQKISLIEYPQGRISSIVFTQGCNFRCPYCHNPELVKSKRNLGLISEKEIFSFLKKRQGKIDAVVITGGEPTLQTDLINFIYKVKKLGFLVKLDTNGHQSEVLEKVISSKIVDYLAMDIKAPLKKYEEVVGTKIQKEKIKKSIQLIMNSGLDYEFRTTIVSSQLKKEDILKIGELIRGARLYVLQKFVPSKTYDQKFLKEETYTDQELNEFQRLLQKYVKKCLVR